MFYNTSLQYYNKHICLITKTKDLSAFLNCSRVVFKNETLTFNVYLSPITVGEYYEKPIIPNSSGMSDKHLPLIIDFCHVQVVVLLQNKENILGQTSYHA